MKKISRISSLQHRRSLRCSTFLGLLVISSPVAFAETGWDPRVIPRGDYRQEIQSTDIRNRPGRPLHVYGNVVRIMDQRDQTPVLYRPVRRLFIGVPK